jgi:hypothetical protein
VDYFCAAKPQRRNLQTVQPHSGVLMRLVIQTKTFALIHTAKRRFNFRGPDDKTAIHLLQRPRSTLLLSEDEAIN